MPNTITWRTEWALLPLLTDKRLYLVGKDHDTVWVHEVTWGQPEHAGMVVTAQDALSAELVLASLVAPELVVAYANIQQREPCLN